MNPLIKKFLMVIGAVAVAIVAIIVVVAAIFIPRSLALDSEATRYLQENVPRIVTGWNAQELLDRATPQLIEATKSRDKIDQYFVIFSRLGALHHLDPPKGNIFSSAYSGQGVSTVGNYRITGQFEHDTAEIQVQLLRVGDGWKISGFHINSDALLSPTASPAAKATPSPAPSSQ